MKTTKIIALILAVGFAFTVLQGCGKKNGSKYQHPSVRSGQR